MGGNTNDSTTHFAAPAAPTFDINPQKTTGVDRQNMAKMTLNDAAPTDATWRKDLTEVVDACVSQGCADALEDRHE
ncbi:MAG: hypothetical protein ACXW2U_05375 [Telluria sp.]